MQSTQHTPGPWQYANGVVDAPINGTAPPTIICEYISARERGYGPLAERQAIADADGHLIAAAPDLLAALRGACDMAEECLLWREQSDDPKDRDALELLQDAVRGYRAAIAKAEGK